ncbi:hypothetical protein SAY87_011647 [Trapa incisa]|uniref:Bulb-type lectin domain-containing protein n=1 Tax=Trapa incisa TaxID=236973 RepID=A0AAN7GLG2_9MYRT|nr:hypothetical protein SAY87_011647 [Trapa incisa]
MNKKIIRRQQGSNLRGQSPTDFNNNHLGIWYLDDRHTVVWVANRDSPVSNGENGVFSFQVNGNLDVMSKDGVTQWSTKLKAAKASYNRTVKLMDTGNLVLLEISRDGGLITLWQSFDEPADTASSIIQNHIIKQN